MGSLSRRRFLLGAGVSAATATIAGLSCSHLARPSAPDGPLSAAAEDLIARAFEGIDSSRLFDVHAHIVGLGTGGTGCSVHPHMTSLLSPSAYLRFSLYRRAAGVEDLTTADAQYVERLVSLLRAPRPLGRVLALAFDRAHDEQGQPDLEHSEFYVPNDYVLGLARAHPDVLVPCASIHPYRPDAVTELERVVRQGAVAVKWLPNAMRIDPSSERCDPFYRKLIELGVPLLTHAGEEKAVEAGQAQRLGNPLLLRRPLELGVKVVMAHCGSLGQNPDLEAKLHGGQEAPWVENFDLFLRLMAEPRYQGLLYGDLSAMPMFNRLGPPLAQLLAREELNSRCLNGSDYPLPAINVLMQTSALARAGYLSAAERRALNEIDQHNPLLFDLVMKRTLALTVEGQRRSLPAALFQVRRELFPSLG